MDERRGSEEREREDRPGPEPEEFAEAARLLPRCVGPPPRGVGTTLDVSVSRHTSCARDPMRQDCVTLAFIRVRVDGPLRTGSFTP